MKKKNLTRALALLCTGILAAGSVTAAVPKSLTGWHGLSRASFPWLTEAEEAEPQIRMPMLENALREYFGLAEEEALTDEHLGQVEVIGFERSAFDGNLPDGYEGKTAVKCVINEGVLPGAPYHDSDFGYELIPFVVRAQYLDLSVFLDEWKHDKFFSFYTLKDTSDPLLTERGVAEVQALFPNTIADALYFLDPMAKPRELRELARMALEYGFANEDTLIDGTEIALSAEDAALFPNLAAVTFTDLTSANELDGVAVLEAVTPTMSPDESHLAESAPILYCALREYFGLVDGEMLTEEMLAQVKSVRFGLSKFNGTLTGTYEGMTAVKCVINNGVLPGVEEHEGLYGDLAYELYPFIARAKYFHTDGITEEWDSMKFRSFFIVKDIKDPTLAEEDIAEMLIQFPNLQTDALVIADPYTQERELKELANIILEYGIGNMVTLFDGMTLDLTRLNTAIFPNLVNMEFLDGLIGLLG